MKKILISLISFSLLFGSTIFSYALENEFGSEKRMILVDTHYLKLDEGVFVNDEIERDSGLLETKNTQGPQVWNFNDPFGIVEGELTATYNCYIVDNERDSIAFIKLTASDPNMLAIVFQLNEDGTLGNNTGIGVVANQEFSVNGLAAGKYAIIIGSQGGSARGQYSLSWNRANPFPRTNETVNIINLSENLMNIAIYYSETHIASNGENIMGNLEYEGIRNFYVPNGYAHITTSVFDVLETGNIFRASFSYQDSVPYSTENALVIEVLRARYSYVDRYYQNNNGSVTSWMRWEDPITGLRTPRVLGDSSEDSAYGRHYLVVDLNTGKVVDFVSQFNYFYGINGRTHSFSNEVQLN